MVGIDLVEHIRLKDNYDRFGLRYLSIKELEIYNSFKLEQRKLEYVCSRLASKEAIFKVFKVGDKTLDFKDIDILNDNSGAPYININGIRRDDLEISISHTLNYSIAIVLNKLC